MNRTDRYIDYYYRAFDIATGTTNGSRRNEAITHARETAERNRVPHCGERQRARARRQIASGYLRAENGLKR
jgi:hypothetical protein